MTRKSTALEGAREVLGDLRPHALGAAVVGLVVAGRERVGAEHDPPLDLGAEARRAGALVHRRRASPFPAAQAEPHTVVAGEVRRRLRRRDHVVGGDARGRRAEASTSSTSPPSSRISVQRPRRRPRPRRARCPRRPAESSRGDAEPKAREVGARGQLHPALDPDRGRVARVAAVACARSSSAASVDVAGQRSALVERGGERDHPVARDRAVGRLQADDPAERGGLADRPAGVGADRARRQPAGDGGRRAAGRAARARARGPTGCGPARRRSSRSRSPSRTRPCSSCRARARRRRRAAGPRWPCRAGGSPRGSASPRWSGCPRCRTGP